MESRLRWLVGGVLGAVALSLGTVAAQAAPIVLKIASPWPAKHPNNVYGIDVFMHTVERETDGAVKFEFYPAGQLGKPEVELQLAENGGIDVLQAAPPYTPDKLPLSGVIGLPGMGSTACQASHAAWKLLRPGGLLYKYEYAPIGLRPLFDGSPPPYEVMTARKRVTSIADLKGLRLKAAGGPELDALRLLGASPVQMESVDVYQAVQRGVLDGRIGPYASVPALHEAHIFHYGTIGAGIGNFSAAVVINENKWNSLPHSVQVAITHAGQVALKSECHIWDVGGQKTIKQLEKKDGWKFYHFTAAQSRHIQRIIAPVVKEWADAMDKAGKPGTKLVAAMKAAVASTPR